jgi:hypothetical protein
MMRRKLRLALKVLLNETSGMKLVAAIVVVLAAKL